MNVSSTITLATACLLWVIELYCMFTPTNELYAQGLIGLPIVSLTVGTLAALVMAMSGIARRKRTLKAIFILNQLLCWPLVFQPVALVGIAIYAVIYSGA